MAEAAEVEHREGDSDLGFYKLTVMRRSCRHAAERSGLLHL